MGGELVENDPVERSLAGLPRARDENDGAVGLVLARGVPSGPPEVVGSRRAGGFGQVAAGRGERKPETGAQQPRACLTWSQRRTLRPEGGTCLRSLGSGEAAGSARPGKGVPSCRWAVEDTSKSGFRCWLILDSSKGSVARTCFEPSRRGSSQRTGFRRAFCELEDRLPAEPSALGLSTRLVPMAAAERAFESATFHGTTLYPADLALLAPGGWLNDSLLTFAMDYLAHVVHAGDESLCFCHPG